MKRNLGVTLGLILIGTLLYFSGESKKIVEEEKFIDFPWNITFPSTNTMKVLGVTLGKTNIEQAKAHFKTEYEIGLYVKNKNEATLEAYYSSVNIAGLSAKVIVSLDIENQPWQAWQKNYVKAKGMPNNEIKYSLNSEDYKIAQRLAIKTLSYIPAINLDDEIINNRFGMDYETITINEKVKYFTYKEKGLAIRMDEEGKEILRYTHPSNFVEIKESIQQEINEEKLKVKTLK